jgi:cyclopropane-fatty-acyl-phospholipid synthase
LASSAPYWLDLGCGWGSLTLFAAQRFRSLRFTSVSNSNSQRELIEGRCRELGLNNVRVKTATNS